MKKRVTLLLSVFCCLFIYGQKSYQYSAPKETGDGWKTDGSWFQKVDTSKIYQLFQQLYNAKHKINSVLLVKDNVLILEEYFNKRSIDQQQDLRSTSKSIRSILLGIALDKGFIDDVNDPISKYLKTHQPKKKLDPRKADITIANLITMSTGLECNDWDRKSKGQEDRVYKKKDWIQYTLDLPMVNNPGEVSNYCSMGVVILAEIISQASGMSIDEFADKYLFAPLGIENVSWGHTSEKKVIASGKRLNMTPRDMAKIGQLILNKGMWKEARVVSQKWVEKSISPKTTITGINYGYLWWKLPFFVKDKLHLSTAATGNGGQYILIFHEINMIAVFTGSAYNSQEDKIPFVIMKDVLLPTLFRH
ncbi:serine hydrolase domain-containing protein [Pseudotenacibaculum haliotis]|uniref:Serine hydrolase domain-containing protein n=1 Tax=Pseudotenacibaculum haliotis TaxID=1862138 RepID=A0ABW5LQ63_9FLAO